MPLCAFGEGMHFEISIPSDAVDAKGLTQYVASTNHQLGLKTPVNTRPFIKFG